MVQSKIKKVELDGNTVGKADVFVIGDDTLQPGDTLRLRPGRVADSGGDFTAAHSRAGAHAAMQELERAAGGEVVAWNDPVAKLGVRTLCAVRLAGP